MSSVRVPLRTGMRTTLKTPQKLHPSVDGMVRITSVRQIDLGTNKITSYDMFKQSSLHQVKVAGPFQCRAA